MEDLPNQDETVETNKDSNFQLESKEYYGTARRELDHYFGNHIGTIILMFQARKENPSVKLKEERFMQSLEGFARGMTRILHGLENQTLKSTSEVNKNIIQEFLTTTESIQNPLDEEEINRIIEKYNLLKG